VHAYESVVMGNGIRVWVEEDVVVNQLSKETILEAAEGFDYRNAPTEAAMVAINQIRAGKHEDAIVTLERAFLPAWEDTAACEARYKEVMGMA
jgi:hypothetical protein